MWCSGITHSQNTLVENGIIYCLNFYLVSIMQDHVCIMQQLYAASFCRSHSMCSPLIPISSQAHHDSRALGLSRIYEVLTCFTTYWAPHLMTVTQSCWSPLGITTSDHHPIASPSFCVECLHGPWPVATCNYLLAENCSAAASPRPPPFKTTLQHHGSFHSSTLKLGSAEQSQKGKNLNRRRFAKLWCYKQLLCWQLCHKEITSPCARCF